MPEVQRERKYFTLRRGLNTVSNEITFPDEFTSDELNYTIESDGSRRRRRGLAEESGGTTKTVDTIPAGQANRSFKWKGAGGNPLENLIVHQFGPELCFTDDNAIASTYTSDCVDLANFKVDSSTTDATVGSEPCSFAVHRGFLVVTHKYLTPFFIDWDGTNLTTEAIQILVRDFEGIDDGINVGTQPGGARSADHDYNLLNRGWDLPRIGEYKVDTGAYPAKNMIPYLGYKRDPGAGTVNPADGTREWDATKMAAEIFQNSSAPQGALFLDPLDTTVAHSIAGGTGDVTLSYDATDFAADPSSNTTLEVTLTGHSYTSSDDDLVISGQRWLMNSTTGGSFFWFGMLNAPYGSGPWTPVDTTPSSGQVQVNIANKLIFHVDAIPNWQSWNLTDPDGYIDGADPIANSEGSALDVGPTVCTAFAGRIWYAGIEDSQWADTIFFSQVSLKTATFGKCFQKADPTDEYHNQLQPDDGGTIIIPNMGKVTQLKAVRNAMLVFTTNGVWEISGGRGGFAADNYSVRQITDAACTAPLSICQFDSATVYTGPRGVSILTPNQYTSQLEEQNISAPVLEPTWNAIAADDQANVQTAYDDAKKRLYVLYRDSATLSHTYDKALVYDLKNQGWYRLGFNYGAAAGIISMFAISDADSSESNQKMKFQAQITATTVDTCDMNQSNYLDFDGSESPLPYLVTGWDSSAGFQRRKQAPIIHVYNKRTGTGWTDAGSGNWTEDNTGSTLMTPFWDWTESTQWDTPASPTAQEDWDASANNYGVSGKIGKQVETYRRVRSFTPLATSNVDGYPVLATRNKVRGRGRVLSMRFDGATAKDSHLLGFTMNYKISRKK